MRSHSGMRAKLMVFAGIQHVLSAEATLEGIQETQEIWVSDADHWFHELYLEKSTLRLVFRLPSISILVVVI